MANKICVKCGKGFIPNSGIQKTCHVCKLEKAKERDFKCPVCGKKVEIIGTHVLKVKDQDHDIYYKNVSDKVDEYLKKGDLLLSEIKMKVKELIGKSWDGLVDKRMAVICPERKWQLANKRKEGKQNPVFNEGVRDKISDSVSKRWSEGNYNKRVNGMLGIKGELSLQYQPEKHTLLYLAEHQYIDFLKQYEDVTICRRCGAPGKKINIHHIDEDHKNFLPSNLEPLCVPCHTAFHYSLQKLPFILIGKTFSFAAAHRLPKYDGACNNLHGHEWAMEICLRKRIDKKTGMVLDFSVLKGIVNTHIISLFDHSYLNKYIKNPTAENILVRVWEVLMFDAHLKGIEKIDLWETSSSRASLDKQGMLSILSDNIEEYAMAAERKRKGE
jgi:6-pyruvoyltetrahydropterin/6-carboxytetrahydropterin synthase